MFCFRPFSICTAEALPAGLELALPHTQYLLFYLHSFIWAAPGSQGGNRRAPFLTERFMRTCLITALSLLVGAAWDSGTAIASDIRVGNTAQLRAVASLYQRYCMRCHGEDYSGSGWRKPGRHIPNFVSAAWQDSRSDAQLLVSILEGKGKHMPAFADRLSKRQARDLVKLTRKASSTRQASAEIDPDDFAKRFAELKKEWEQLRKQFRRLNRVPTRSKRKAEPEGMTPPVHTSQ
jgi:mono/diheme cytochrome c family protein